MSNKFKRILIYYYNLKLANPFYYTKPEPDQVARNIWLGGFYPMTSDVFIKKNKIGCIINMAGGDKYTLYMLTGKNYISIPKNIGYLEININDEMGASISNFFKYTYRLIKRCTLAGRNIYVHCAAGVSRSTTILLYYIMRRHGVTLEVALNYLSRFREIIFPNIGFMYQLMDAEDDLIRRKKIHTTVLDEDTLNRIWENVN